MKAALTLIYALLLTVAAFVEAGPAEEDADDLSKGGMKCEEGCPTTTAGLNLLLRDEMMYIFGGANGGGYGIAPVYKYNTTCKCSGYSMVEGSEFGAYPAETNPASLVYASSFFDNDKNYYLFGGMRYYLLYNEYFNTVWKLSKSTGVWTQATPWTTTTCGSTQPSSGSYCQCDTRHNGDCTNGEWSNIVPMTRYGSATDVWGAGGSNGKGALVLYGGTMSPYPVGLIGFDSVVYNDLWMLDLGTYEWTMLSAGDVSALSMGNTFPQAGGGGIGVVYNNVFFLYGGAAGSYLSPATNNYVWKWSLNGGSSWTKIGAPADFNFRAYPSIVRLDYDYNINSPHRTNGKDVEVIIANGAEPAYTTEFRYTAYKWKLATNTFDIFAITQCEEGIGCLPGPRWGAAAVILDSNNASSMIVYGGTGGGLPPISRDWRDNSVSYWQPYPPYPAFLDLATREWTSAAASIQMGWTAAVKAILLSVLASLMCMAAL